MKCFIILLFATIMGNHFCQGQQTGQLQIQFINKMNKQTITKLPTDSFTNAVGNRFVITELNYYVSNFQLTKKDGSNITLPIEYFLIKQDDPSSMTISLSHVPAGTYSKISFLLGVDSLRNVSGEQTGSLDPANKMYRTWNSGYVFLRLKGMTSASSSGKLHIAIGGIKPAANSLRKEEIVFKKPIQIKANNCANVQLVANMDQLFSGKSLIDFSKEATIMGGTKSVKVADNYGNHLFSHQ